ncbi:small integral membrane protein 23-like [Sarcophilus harrisii]
MQVGHVGIVWKRKADSSRRIVSTSIDKKQNLENQLKDQPKEPTKAMGKWLRESLDILQERLERELRVLEQQVKDLEEWLDYHLKDLGSEEKCGTITSHF